MTDRPKTWGEMSAVEKGALLLAHHNGEAIERRMERSGSWFEGKPTWSAGVAYRVKPKPVRETRRANATFRRSDGKSGLVFPIALTFEENEPLWETLRHAE